MGRYLRHGEGYPDWSLRLFDRRAARWSDDPVHERVMATGQIGTLEGDLLHESAESLENYLDKQNYYSTLAADEALASGERATALHLVLSPLLRFAKFYVFRLGFLDGLPGLVHILAGCAASFAKYAKMLNFQRRHAMKVLVTGAAGFIGMHVCERLLARGDEVVGVDNLNDYYDVALKEARLARLSPNGAFQAVPARHRRPRGSPHCLRLNARNGSSTWRHRPECATRWRIRIPM
jgi:hypothetical protein